LLLEILFSLSFL